MLRFASEVAMNVAQKLISSHLVSGSMTAGDEIAIRVDQTLTQDATGTLVMLELEAMELDRVRTEVSVQYVDHNLIQVDSKNPDDHLFLLSAAQRFGLWFSRPGNGVSHPVHQQRFGVPGKTLVGSDSHTPAAGAIGMLALGAGGLEVALAMAGEPLYLTMPEIWGVEVVGKLPHWVSAKDVILEMLRRHGVKGGRGRIIEYYGEGLDQLSVMDRHVIANMGTELGATTTVFPSDEAVREFLQGQERGDDWVELLADAHDYDVHERIDLSALEPLIAKPSSPGNVVRVRELVGEPIYQSYIGSSANPGFADFAIAADIVEGKQVASHVSFDVNPTSRQLLEELTADGTLLKLIKAGARIHQAGCNGCIGMGQAPAWHENSLRTVPRNFPDRSGTHDDRVFLVSPETAAASALHGVITDPRELEMEYPGRREPAHPMVNTEMLVPPLPVTTAHKVKLRKGPNVKALPELEALPEQLDLKVILKVGDDVSTDEILRAGAEVLPFRSNIEAISRFAFDVLDPDYYDRALAVRESGGHLVVGGHNYGQGSSREHAALAPRFLGLRVVLAKSFARIHWQNLVNFGVLPLTFADESDYERVKRDAVVTIVDPLGQMRDGALITVDFDATSINAHHALSARQIEILEHGGLTNLMKRQLDRAAE